MKGQGKMTGTLLVSVAIFCLLPAGVRAGESRGRFSLISDDFSAWRGNAGQWEVVGDTFVNRENEKLLSSKPGSGVIVNGLTGRTRNILSKAEFGDVRAHIEFMVPKGSNSGVYFMGRYEIQVFDSWGVEKPTHSDCGGIYQRWDNKGYEGHPPRVNVSRGPGQWQTFDAVFRAPRFDKNGKKISNARFEKIAHNGVLVHEDVVLTGPTRASAYNDEKPVGPLMVQGDHGPVAYRNIWIEPAGALAFFAMDTGTKDAKHKSAKDQVQTLKELGYAGIGCSGDVNLAEMLEELDKNDLRLFAVYLGVNIDSEGPKYDPKLTDAVKVLKGRNAMLWLFVRSKKLKPSSPEGNPRAVEIIQEVADMAAEARLRVALYPHHAFWLERVEDAVRIAKKVDRKNVGVTFNLCHWLRVNDEKSLKPLLKRAMPYLFVVSINGADSSGKDWKQLIQTLDRGSFDMLGFLRTLDEVGYTGPMGLQHYGIKGDAYENLKRSMNGWRQLSQRLEKRE